MVNYNGEISTATEALLSSKNRGFLYGDSLFETIRVSGKKIYFWEDHYLRLMASMRILRMEIPMNFTMEFLEGEILRLLETAGLDQGSARVRLSVYRQEGGLYNPETNDTAYLVEATGLQEAFYTFSEEACRLELFKDHYLNKGLLTNVKSNNRISNILGSIYAAENGYQNCVLLNYDKHIAETLNGNIFLVHGKQLKTPPLSDGCIDGIIRKKILELVGKLEHYDLEETSISPFELLRAEEVFYTNTIVGIRAVTHYRKKVYGNSVSRDLLGKLNAAARLA